MLKTLRRCGLLYHTVQLSMVLNQVSMLWLLFMMFCIHCVSRYKMSELNVIRSLIFSHYANDLQCGSHCWSQTPWGPAWGVWEWPHGCFLAAWCSSFACYVRRSCASGHVPINYCTGSTIPTIHAKPKIAQKSQAIMLQHTCFCRTEKCCLLSFADLKALQQPNCLSIWGSCPHMQCNSGWENLYLCSYSANCLLNVIKSHFGVHPLHFHV